MSLPCCVIRLDSTNVVSYFESNKTTTPLCTRVWGQPNYYYFTSGGRTYVYSTGATDLGPTYAFALPITFASPYYWSVAPFYTARNETGYEVYANKSIADASLSVTVKKGSVLWAIFLTGETAVFEAVVAAGSQYRFVQWNLGASLVSTDNPYSSVITADKTLTAMFEQYKWTLTTASSNPTVGDATIEITDNPASSDFEDGVLLHINATVKQAYAATYKFSHWELDSVEISTQARIQITTAEAAETYTAVFIPINYALNVTPDNASSGSVETYLSSVKQISNTGLTVAGLSGARVVAIPTFGYALSGWYAGGVLQSEAESYSFTMPDADLSLEARFVPLSTLTLTVSKTNYAYGEIRLYHLEDVLDATATVAAEQLVANVFIGNQYKLEATAPLVIHQFDGWYSKDEAGDFTVLVSELPYVYIDVSGETGIDIQARFSARVVCAIVAQVSDTSFYTENNPAEAAGCTDTINTAPDGTNSWLSGKSISVTANQAYGWRLVQWNVQKTDTGETLLTLSSGQTGFGQTLNFTLMPYDITVIAISVYVLPPNNVTVKAKISDDSAAGSGIVEVSPYGVNHLDGDRRASADIPVNTTVTLTAIPANGYAFEGWYGEWSYGQPEDTKIYGAGAVYSFILTTSMTCYAKFVASSHGSSLLLFEGSGIAREMTWIGKVLSSIQPVNFSSARLISESYPSALILSMAGSSPSVGEPSMRREVVARGETPFRLPMARPERFSAVGVRCASTVSTIVVSTSMEGVANG